MQERTSLYGHFSDKDEKAEKAGVDRAKPGKIDGKLRPAGDSLLKCRDCCAYLARYGVSDQRDFSGPRALVRG